MIGSKSKSRALAFIVLLLGSSIAHAAAPVVVSKAYVAKSGSIVMLFVGTPGSLPVYPTKLTALPTITINGTPVTVQGPFWSSVTHLNPWVAYQLPPVTPADVVLWSTPAGWVTATQGVAAAESGTAANYTGQLEPGFDDQVRSLQVGFNGPANSGQSIGMFKNVMRRAGLDWGGNSVSTADGQPPLMLPNGVVSASVWSSQGNNGIDPAMGFPAPQGVWTFIADETAPAAPMAVALMNGGFVTRPNQPINPQLFPGRLAGGIEVGKRWTWTVATTPPWTVGLSLAFGTPNGRAGPFTLKNLKLFEPGSTPTFEDVGLNISDNFTRMLTAAPGIAAPVVRMMEATAGSDGASSLVGPSDLTAATDFSYASRRFWLDPITWPTANPGLTGDRRIPISQCRPYGLTVTPNVYTAQLYMRCVSSNGTAYPYQFTPASFGLGYDWLYANQMTGGQLGAPNNVVVLEFVTGDAAGNSINHNLQSGQFITFGNMPAISITNANGVGTAAINGSMCVLWVTSPNSFIVLGSSTGVAGARKMGWVTAPTTINVPASFSVGTNGRALPPEAVAGISNSTGHGAIWVAINHCMSDAGVRAMATRLFNATSRGTRVYVQFSNEILIPNFQYGWGIQAGSLQGLGQVQAVMQRTGEVQKVFNDVWGDDASSIVRVFQPFVWSPGQTLMGLKYAQTNSIPIDVVSIGSYVNMDISPSFTMAAAAICANDPRSIANPANGGAGVLMPMAAYQDLTRHHVLYNLTYNGPNSIYAQHLAAIKSSGYGVGAFVHAPPKLTVYEGAFTAAIPPGVSKVSKIVRSGLSHDFMYHPSYGDTINAYLLHLQAAGVDTVCIESLMGGRQSGGAGFNCPDGNDNVSSALWMTYAHQQQLRGPGLTNRYWAADLGGDGAAHDAENESPGARAYMSWILSAYSGKRR